VIRVQDVNLHSRVGRAPRPPHITTLRSSDSVSESDHASIRGVPGRHRRAPHASTLTRRGGLIAILVAAAIAGFATARMLTSSNHPQQTPACSETCTPTEFAVPRAAPLSPRNELTH
jgi:hypothetical protein